MVPIQKEMGDWDSVKYLLGRNNKNVGKKGVVCSSETEVRFDRKEGLLTRSHGVRTDRYLRSVL